MDYKKKEQLASLNGNDFEQEIVNFSQENKNELLYFIIDTLKDTSKLILLLQKGASAKQLIGEEEVMLWTVAFSRDLYKSENELYLPLLIPYIFDNFTNKFKDESEIVIKSSLRKYKAIINKSNMAYNSLGYESNKIEEKLDDEYYRLLNDLEIDLEKLNINTIKTSIKSNLKF